MINVCAGDWTTERAIIASNGLPYIRSTGHEIVVLWLPMTFFYKVQSKFSVQSTDKFFSLIDNYHKTIYGPVRTECSSCMVLMMED